MTFINSGNRPISIMKATLSLEQIERSYSEVKCRTGSHSDTIPYEFEPVTLKPGEILNVRAKLKEKDGEARYAIKFSDRNMQARQLSVSGCARFYIITPSNVVTEADVPMFSALLNREPLGAMGYGAATVSAPAPLVLHQSHRFFWY
jgi:hypothetical protein